MVGSDAAAAAGGGMMKWLLLLSGIALVSITAYGVYGPEVEYTPAVDPNGQPLTDFSGIDLVMKQNDIVLANMQNLDEAVAEYLKFKEQTPNDHEHLEELLAISSFITFW